MRILSVITCLMLVTAAHVVAQTTTLDPDRVVVHVNGEPVYAVEVQMGAQQIAQATAAAGRPIDGERIGKAAMQKLVDGRLMVQEARRRGLTVDRAAVAAALAEAERDAGGPDGLSTELARQGLTRERLERITADTNLMTQLSDRIAADIEVSDAQVAEFYAADPARFRIPEQVKIQHIVIKVAADAPAAVKNEARARAEAARQRVLRGEDFASLARELSEAANAENGGETGFFGRDPRGSDFSEAVFRLQPGDISGVVESSFGYHVVKMLDHRAARTPPLDEVAGQIRDRLVQQATAEQIDAIVEKLRDSAEVVPVVPPGARSRK